LTVDVTVARDYLDDGRPRHVFAVRLFELARQGTVALAIASSGYNYDVHVDGQQLSKDLHKMIQRESIVETVQLPYPGPGTFPGSTLVPGHGFPELHPAWDAVSADWRGPGTKPNSNDRMHVETHLLEGRDLFVTDDKGLLTMCQRLRDEHDVAIHATRLEECVARYDSDGT
jgi:hypothetical protein